MNRIHSNTPPVFFTWNNCVNTILITINCISLTVLLRPPRFIQGFSKLVISSSCLIVFASASITRFFVQDESVHDLESKISTHKTISIIRSAVLSVSTSMICRNVVLITFANCVIAAAEGFPILTTLSFYIDNKDNVQTNVKSNVNVSNTVENSNPEKITVVQTETEDDDKNVSNDYDNSIPEVQENAVLQAQKESPITLNENIDNSGLQSSKNTLTRAFSSSLLNLSSPRKNGRSLLKNIRKRLNWEKRN